MLNERLRAFIAAILTIAVLKASGVLHKPHQTASAATPTSVAVAAQAVSGTAATLVIR